jgi:hypothetical protein
MKIRKTVPEAEGIREWLKRLGTIAQKGHGFGGDVI